MKPSLTIITNIKVLARHCNNLRVSLRIVIRKPTPAASPPQPLGGTWRAYYGYASFLILLALCIPASATTIVIRKTATDIFVAADSKVTRPEQADSLTDKIVNLKGNWYFASSGVYELPMRFDVFQSARLCILASSSPSLTKSPTMREFADSCSDRIARELYEPLRALKPDLYATYITNQVILELAFFGEENGQLKVYSRDIFPDSLFVGLTRIVSRDCVARCKATFGLGYYELFGSVFARNPNYWKVGEEKERACRLVTLEIEKHPAKVSWPVKVLHLSVNGTAKWFTHEKACEKETPKPAPKPTRPRRQKKA